MKRIVVTCLMSLILTAVWADEIIVNVEKAYEAKVVGDGTVAYAQTNDRKAQLTAGNSLTLKLYDLPEGDLTRITLSMKSNKASGAGSLLLTLGKQTLWSISAASFKSKTWYGAFSESYVDIAKNVSVALQDTLVLTIKASENSLYFQSLTLTYTPPVPVAHTVYFETGTAYSLPPITEVTPGAGITLPSLPDPDENWRFVNWIVAPQEDESTTRKEGYSAAWHLSLSKDLTLYAQYATTADLLLQPDTVLHDGQYAIGAEDYYGQTYLLAGAMTDNVLPITKQALALNSDSAYCLRTAAVPLSLRYQVAVKQDTMFLQHVETGEYIGYYSNNKLANRQNPWLFQRTKYQSFVVYYWRDTKAYMLYNWTDDDPEGDETFAIYIKSFNLSTLRRVFMFYPVADVPYTAPIIYYTSHPIPQTPLSETGMDALPEQIYDIMGRAVGTDWHALPTGIYILRQGGKSLKRYRP